MSVLKTILPIIFVFLAILLITIFLSESVFGDLTATDSYKPLWVVVPVMLSVLGYLIYKFNKK